MFDHRSRTASIPFKTGEFSVPPDFAENNAKAIKYPAPR